ncbi:MAG TPA: hypothetical protein VFC31_05150 [Candidatus Limnocylindria bacterium]|nr:hypothetical protein [Candidatus Limnocylindria bacterium]
MTREQGQLLRLLLMCAAWAIGQTLTIGLAVDSGAELIVPAALAIGVYAISEDLARPRLGGGNVRYWRGRRIDDDERPGGRWS